MCWGLGVVGSKVPRLEVRVVDHLLCGESSPRIRADELAEDAREAMQQRLNIYNEANTNKENILVVNEQVMTKLDELTIRLGAIQTREGLGDVRLDSAMNEILHLINRTNQYDIRQ